MKRPKGLCRLPGDDSCFLDRVVTLHQQAGHAVAVATTPGLHPLYADLLASEPSVRWILGEAGQGTGHTVTAVAEELAESASHLWLHPVDVPTVTIPLIRILQEWSRKKPEAVIVPEYRGQPGHPVILPAGLLAQIRADPISGPMRPWLLAHTQPGSGPQVELLTLDLDHASFVTDFDDEAALRFGSDNRKRDGQERS
jgi:CTP:molybdopterin cytidylyltransferase MocA